MTPPRCAQGNRRTARGPVRPPLPGPAPSAVLVLPHRWLHSPVHPVRLLWTFTRSLCACEHVFVSIKGSPYANFRRSLEARKLSLVLPAAAELPWINLADSLEILALMAQEGDERFERAAARWIGRLLTETPPLTLKELRWVVAMVEQLPRCRESLNRIARRR
jgi:hypothetical protein